jgi:hypothetical protein
MLENNGSRGLIAFRYESTLLGESLKIVTQPTLQGKPDRVAEEPTGLPGYPLLCSWTQGPAGDTLEASLNCFLGDDKGQPAQLSSKTSWAASVSGDASLLKQMLPNQTVNLTVKSKTRDGPTLAIQNKVPWMRTAARIYEAS